MAIQGTLEAKEDKMNKHNLIHDCGVKLRCSCGFTPKREAYLFKHLKKYDPVGYQDYVDYCLNYAKRTQVERIIRKD